jgi:hypothetical protein
MNYSRAAKTAEKLIRKHGTKCVLRVPSGSAEYDPDTAGYAGLYAAYDGICVVTSYKASAIDGTVIRASDKSLLCVLPAEPRPSVGLMELYDKAGELTDTYTVGLVEKICPDNSTVIAYKVQGRK